MAMSTHTESSHYYAVGGHRFTNYRDALDFAESLLYPHTAIRWIDPEAPWN